MDCSRSKLHVGSPRGFIPSRDLRVQTGRTEKIASTCATAYSVVYDGIPGLWAAKRLTSLHPGYIKTAEQSDERTEPEDAMFRLWPANKQIAGHNRLKWAT